MKTWFIVILLAAIAGGSWWYYKNRQTADPQYITTTVGRGDVTQVVTATGTLAMANTNVSQDARQGAPLTLNLTSS